MIEAERVHSTPPLNLSPKSANGLSRRNMLGALAVLPVALPAAVAAAEPDPIFATIDAHRRARAAHLTAIEELNRLEKIYGVADWGFTTDRPCHDDNATFEILLGAAASTLPGLLAKLAYLREIADSDDAAWMLDECESGSLRLIDSLAASLRNAGVLA